ncbi:endo-polygalacturonase [Cadophora sp. MPI-SDFR-AT-0126]|nr:endo-polygalacturonase [Leotiomycetes sp. MPI-SDFR-AT-0126]
MVTLKSLLASTALLAATYARNTLPLPSTSLSTRQHPTNPSNSTIKLQLYPPSDKSWRPVDIYLAKLSEVNTTSGSGIVHDTSFAYFDFSGTVSIRVIYDTGVINNATVRPYSYNIAPQIQGHGKNRNTLTFSLSQPRNLVIQVNEQVFDALHLFAGAIETDVPSEDDPDVIYFGPGIHNMSSTGGLLQVPSGKTVYIAGGGVLTARVNFTNVKNSSLRGHGVIYNSNGGAVTVVSSTNITVSGITALNPNGYALTAGQAKDLTISDFKSFSSKGNGDGIDVFSSQNVLITNIFMRNSDDCVALYNHRWDYYGNTSNITVQDSSLWADVAHPINVGTHGNSDNPETMDGLVFKNIDILDHREPQMLYQGCIALNPGDSNLIQNVLIEDIRVEDFREGQLVNFRVMYNTKYNTSPGRGIRNVTVRNMRYEGTRANPSIFEGYDDERSIDGVRFEGLVINGKGIADQMKKPTWYLASDFVPMFANDHTKNLLDMAIWEGFIMNEYLLTKASRQRRAYRDWNGLQYAVKHMHEDSDL